MKNLVNEINDFSFYSSLITHSFKQRISNVVFRFPRTNSCKVFLNPCKIACYLLVGHSCDRKQKNILCIKKSYIKLQVKKWVPAIISVLPGQFRILRINMFEITFRYTISIYYFEIIIEPNYMSIFPRSVKVFFLRVNY